ncbi:MAG TPA: hypothetical protein VH298_07570, partial [Jatrophihabitans sp.]|nr:hypothetical protein [Jatrophihabitans sp.]
RLLLSVVATGMAPGSFYVLGPDGDRQRAHYSGLPVDFTAAAITSLGERATSGFATYNVVNAHDDGASLDQFVDWLIERGHPIIRIAGFGQWRARFEIALKSLPERQRKFSVLPLLHAYASPALPAGSTVPTEQFQTGVRRVGVADGLVPRIGPDLIEKYVSDLRLLSLV